MKNQLLLLRWMIALKLSLEQLYLNERQDDIQIYLEMKKMDVWI